MKFTRIFAAAAAAGVLLALCGCGDSGSSSADTEISSQAVQPASKQTDYKTADEMFTLRLNERFSKYQGAYPADFEFLFVDSNTNTTVGIMEMSGLHITPEFYCETIKSHYEELYGAVTSTPAEQDGLPAHLLEAEFVDEEDGNKEFLFHHKVIGYGNGDLIVLVVTVPKETPDEAEKAVSDIMEGITYLGEPIKTEPETHENEFFSVTADKDWYFYSKDGTEATIRPNIAVTMAERYGSFKISAERSDSTAQELADADAEEFGTNEKITDIVTNKNATCLGRDAVCVSCVLNSDYMNLKRETYYFESSGAVCKVQILAPDDCFGEFSETLGSLTDTIEIK